MSGVGVNGYPSSKSIALREWVELALQTVDVSAVATNGKESFFVSSFGEDPASWPADIRKSLAVSSASYLMSALKVARSLADQICQAEERGDNGWRPILPPPDADWAGRVAVHLSNSHQNIINICNGDLQPLPLQGEKSNNKDELRDVLNYLTPEESLWLKEDVAEDESGVASAEIVLFPNDKGSSPKDNPMKHIYALGLVFYEIFSGGERHPSTATPQTNSNTASQASVNDQADDLGKFFDLEGHLNILDDMGEEGVGEAADILGNFESVFDNVEDQMPNRKKAAQSGSSTVRSVSVEQLQLKGLPASLCDLIGNMIDCINGDLRGEEAYQSMSDVRNDLQLMMDKPNRFLYDMDIDKLSATGLQLNEAVFGREAQFAAIQSVYKRSISGGGNELGIIVGPSGIGKSVLANRLGSSITARGGLFLTGKFDQLQQAKPFSALAAAFNEYCKEMSKEGRSSHLKEVASKLRVALGGEAGARHLVKVIPNLSLILGESVDNEEDQQCADAEKRLQYLLCQFVDVISSFSGAPVTLFLDDVQWADPGEILFEPKREKLELRCTKC